MKLRTDFVSNSSSSSFVILNTNINDTLIQTMRKIAHCCSLGEDNDRDVKYLKELEDENMKKLDLYVPKYTCVMMYGDEAPRGISNENIEKYVKDGEFVKDKEEVWKWFQKAFLKDRKDGDEDESYYEKRGSWIAEYNKNSLALSKLYFEHNPIPTKEEYLKKLDSPEYTEYYEKRYINKLKKNAEEHLEHWKNKRLAFERILEGYKIIYCHVNTSGDGVDDDRLFADPFMSTKDSSLECIDFEQW